MQAVYVITFFAKLISLKIISCSYSSDNEYVAIVCTIYGINNSRWKVYVRVVPTRSVLHYSHLFFYQLSR